METVFLKPGRDATVRGGNPWIFSGAIGRLEPATIAAGALVKVHDAAGALIGLGYYNPATTIAVRMLAWGETPALPELIARRLKDALGLRELVVNEHSDCYRLVNGEGDGLAGVVIDRYGDALVMQLLTAGADQMRDELVSQLTELLQPGPILERSSGAVRKNEGLEDRAGVLAGSAITEIEVRENGNLIVVNFEYGQKTGYFLDQRENRAALARLARGAKSSTRIAMREVSRWRRLVAARSRPSPSTPRSARLDGRGATSS